METKTVYLVSVTTFHDDYKLRGNDPSTLYGPKVFTDRDEAQAWLNKHLYNHYKHHSFSKEEFIEYGLPLEKLRERYGTFTLTKDCASDGSLLERIADICCDDGEYVSRTLSYTWSEEELEFPIVTEKRRKSKK